MSSSRQGWRNFLRSVAARRLGESIASAMGQAIEAAKGSAVDSGWNADDDTLVAQGRASAAAGRLLPTTVASQLIGLSERLAQPGAAMLDVGTGVAELAVVPIHVGQDGLLET